MARNDFSFVEVGERYQLKEDGWVGDIVILEDKSDDEWWHFVFEIEGSCDGSRKLGEKDYMKYRKGETGAYRGQVQILPAGEYTW